MTDSIQPSFPLRAVVLDWAGTVVDHGSCAPVAALEEAFRQRGVELRRDEARAAMGKAKREHIHDIFQLPTLRHRWHEVFGSEPTDEDEAQLFSDFSPIQLEIIERYAVPIAGALAAIDDMRSLGLGIGSSTGYTRLMMDRLAPAAAEHGFRPDVITCADDAPQGRPAPWMIYRNMLELDAYPPSTVVKIGDTVVDVEAGHNAGVWTIGVAVTGNEIGLDHEELAGLGMDEARHRIVQARARLEAAGAHYVVDALAEALPAIENIARRVLAGERP